MTKETAIHRLKALLTMCDFEDAYGEHIDNTEYEEAVDMAIKALEQREQKWIPVEKALPEEKDAGILKKLGTNKRSDYVLATVEVKGERMTVTACTYDGAWHWDKKYAFPDYEVVAWMPLPDPYSERRTDDE